MVTFNWLVLASGGLVSGLLAGLLGVGGGVLLVPFLVALGYTPLQSVATSSLAILITSASGSFQNWRMGHFDGQRVMYLGIPALITAQIGVHIANRVPSVTLLFLFALLLLVNIFLVILKKRLTAKQQQETKGETLSNVEWNHHSSTSGKPAASLVARLATGGAGGILAGLFGVGGGVIMVPLQMLLLSEPIKVAIQTSLGVVVITAASACFGHAVSGNVLFLEGLILGAGGLLGAQVSTRLLPKLPNSIVNLAFCSFLGILSFYMFWRAVAL